MPLVHEIYRAGTVPILSRTLISLYIEVVECEGNIANVKVGRVSEIDPRVDDNQLWTGQVEGERYNLIVIHDILIERDKAGVVTSRLSETTSTPVDVQMSEIAKGKHRQVDMPKRTENPPMLALEASPVGQGKRKRVNNPEISQPEPVQRVHTFIT